MSTLDVAELSQARELVVLANSQAPIGGVFHLAMVLKDRFLANQVSFDVHGARILLQSGLLTLARSGPECISTL